MTNRQFLQETNFDSEKDVILNDVDKGRLLAKQMKMKTYKEWEKGSTQWVEPEGEDSY